MIQRETAFNYEEVRGRTFDALEGGGDVTRMRNICNMVGLAQASEKSAPGGNCGGG